MKKLLLLIMSISSVLLLGCSPAAQSQEPFCRVVTQIDIQVENAANPGQCHYSNPAKLTKTLNYLRRLAPWDRPAADPEADPGARYRITLQFSDGSTKSYDQISYYYLREDGGPWREIEPEYALRLPLLLTAVPPDGE